MAEAAGHKAGSPVDQPGLSARCESPGASPVSNSLRECIARHARDRPETIALTLVDATPTRMTYAELDNACTRSAGYLYRQGVRRDDLVLIVALEPGDAIETLLGALHLGALPSIVPCRVPLPGKDVLSRQVGSLAQTFGSRFIVTKPVFAGSMTRHCQGLDCRVMVPATHESPEQANDAPPRGDDRIASERTEYVQFTSGSTGQAKGVRISSRATMQFIESFSRDLGLQPTDSIASWLPLSHDFGLFAGLALPLARGIPVSIMSTLRFLRRPGDLLTSIGRERSTVCWIINFAMRHVARFLETRPDFSSDLRSIRILGTGGEPIRSDSCETFFRQTARMGLRREHLVCGYGMAESTLAVSVTPPGKPPRIDRIDKATLRDSRRSVRSNAGIGETMEVVSCGRPLSNATVAISDRSGTILPDRFAGEIVIKSTSMFSGYLGAKGARAADAWFRTGDEGYLADGELFVLGRLDDTINMGGEKILPSEIERVVEAMPPIKTGSAAAFGVCDERRGTATAVVVATRDRSRDDRDLADIALEVRGQVTRALGIVLDDVLIFERTWIERTVNGKIARGPTRDKYLAYRAYRREQLDLSR
ncbi:MAG: hypothetical protein DWQ08_06880 [Proteobacteria bacterium]|nr:MAG: hypothetical protein DWQ08_06880 [Pseudomonadota bacterium]